MAGWRLIVTIFLILLSCTPETGPAELASEMQAEISTLDAELASIDEEMGSVRDKLDVEQLKIRKDLLLTSTLQKRAEELADRRREVDEKLAGLLSAHGDLSGEKRLIHAYIARKSDYIYDLQAMMTETREKALAMVSIDTPAIEKKREMHLRTIETLEAEIGREVTALDRHFGQLDEVKKINLEFVKTYYQTLINSIPHKSEQLDVTQEEVLHAYLEKMKKLYPYSEFSKKAERKLVPLTARKHISELVGPPLVFVMIVFLVLCLGFGLCLKGYLRGKTREGEQEKVFTAVTSSHFFSSTEQGEKPARPQPELDSGIFDDDFGDDDDLPS